MKRCFAIRGPMPFLAALACFVAAPLAQPQQPESISASAPIALTPELRGDLAMARQQYLAAIEDYRDTPEKSAEIWNKLGLAYHHLFAMNEAKQDYERALRLRPKYPEALNNLGAVYYARGDFHKAEKFYRRALRLNPNAASILSNLGTDYFAERKTEKGLDAYRRAFAADPLIFENSSPQLVSESLPARERAQQDFCIARLFAQAGQNERALDFLRKAMNEGFDDRRKILEDQTLASLRATPQFAQLMSEQRLR